MNTNNLEGKTAIVTGASRGIGRAVALRLAEAGAWVLINCASNHEKAAAVLEEIEKLKAEGRAPSTAGGKVAQFSVSDEKAVESAIAEVVSERGGVEILVNNAGVTRDGLLLRHSVADWDAVIDTNLKGTFLCTRAVTKSMMKARSGSIINMSSVVGEMGNAGQGSYCASKAGIIGFTKSAAKELGARNIRVNAIAPGFIDTDMTEALSEESKAAMLAGIPLRRLGATSDIAEAALWLASSASQYVTGQVISVNGGLHM